MPDHGSDLQGRPALMPGIERTDRGGWENIGGVLGFLARTIDTDDSIRTNRQDDLVRRLE